MRSSITNRYSVVAASVAAVLTGNAWAEQAQETMVVTGQSIPGAEVIIDSDALQKLNANELRDVFRSEPEVRIGGGVGAAQKIYVRGMEDTKLNITVDGASQAGNFYHHQGRIAIEPELLKQVTAAAGAGRATNGPGAIGGAIQFETKNPEDLLESGQRFGSLVKAGYYSNADAVKGSVTGYGRLNDQLSALASIVYSDFDDYQDGNGDTQAHTESESLIGLVKLVADLSDDQQLSLSYESLKDEGVRLHRPEWQPNDIRNIPVPQEMTRTTFIARYRLAPASNPWLDFDATVYNNKATLDHTPGPYGDYTTEFDSVGGDMRNTSRVGNVEWVYGFEFRRDKAEGESPDYSEYNQEKGRVLGVYTQADWQVAPAWLLSAGLRYDDYHLEEFNDNEFDHDGFSPNISVHHYFNDNLTAYAGWARAIRGAEIGELFRLGYAPSAEGRKEERADNVEIGIDWSNDSYWLSASAFKSEIKDVAMYLWETREVANAGDLDNQGFSLETGYQGYAWRASLGYSYSRPELNGEPLSGEINGGGVGTAVGNTWITELSYQLHRDIEVGYIGTYVERLTKVAEGSSEKPGYALHDIYARWLPLQAPGLSMTLSVNNLFDKAYRDHASYGDINELARGTLEPGRDIRLSASYAF